MQNRLLTAIFAAMLVVAGTALTTFAGDAPCDGCVPDCASCGEKVCVTHAKPGKETKHCWDVECVDVCIPAVRFPWECGTQDSCDGCCDACPPPKCGRVRCVRKLKRIEYECDVCEYEHRIECRCPNCGPIGCDACLPASEWFQAPVEGSPFAPLEAAPSAPIEQAPALQPENPPLPQTATSPYLRIPAPPNLR